MIEDKKCSQCKGRMELGQLVDQNYAVSGAQEWATHADGILGLGLTDRITIESYRCIECGFLENYAPSEERKNELEGIKKPEKTKKFFDINI